MFECVVTSDWHLGGLVKHFHNHLERQEHEIDKSYRYAISNGIKDVVVAGDVSDVPNMPEAAYMTLLRICKKYDGMINTHYIPGNHDFSDIRKTSMDLLNLLYKTKYFSTFKLYMTPEEVEIGGVPINFLPYPCLEAPKSKRPHLNFSHVAYNKAIGDNGRPLRVSTEFIQNKGDFNVSGHIHTYQYLKSKRALYCGSPYQKNFGESLPKGFVHLKARYTKEEIQIRHLFVDSKPDFQFINVVINSRKDWKKLSSSDAFRYKVWVGEGVEVPKDLRIQFPNITGGVFSLATKQKEQLDDPSKMIVARSSLDIKANLSNHLKAAGHDKAFRKQAFLESAKAANEIGVSIF